MQTRAYIQALAVLASLSCSDAPPETATISGAGAAGAPVAETRQKLTLAWQASGPDAPTLRYEGQGAVVGRKLYVFGGFVDGVGWPVTTGGEVFDLDTRTWKALAPAPVQLSHAGRATDGKAIYFVGGFLGDGPGGSTNQAWKYDPSSDTWHSLPPLPEERGGGALVLLNGKLHYYGGAIRPADENTITSDHGEHWALDLANPAATWTPLAPMPNPRNHLGGAALGGKLYAVGGQHLHDEKTGNQASVDVYDPASDTWSPAAYLPIPIGHLISNTLEYQGRVLAISGITDNSTKLETVYAFDPSVGDWSELTPLPEPRHSPISAVIGNTLIVAAGSLSTAREIRAQTWLGTLNLDASP